MARKFLVAVGPSALVSYTGLPSLAPQIVSRLGTSWGGITAHTGAVSFDRISYLREILPGLLMPYRSALTHVVLTIGTAEVEMEKYGLPLFTREYTELLRAVEWFDVPTVALPIYSPLVKAKEFNEVIGQVGEAVFGPKRFVYANDLEFDSKLLGTQILARMASSAVKALRQLE